MTHMSQSWRIGPFVKEGKPLLYPTSNSVFYCNITNKLINWEVSNVYNPAAIVRNGELHIIYRADGEHLGGVDAFGNNRVVCRLGHAVSKDGVNFRRSSHPVLYPDNDNYKSFEWWGGCGDLHIIESDSGRYYMNYDAWTGYYNTDCGYDLGVERIKSEPWQDVLMTAWSDDLITWHKCGPALNEKWTKYWNHSRSGVVISREINGRLIAERINGKYYMYMSHKGTLLSSTDLLKWDIVLDKKERPVQLFPEYREDSFDGRSHEAGAAAIITKHGIVYFYNAFGKIDSDIKIRNEGVCWSLAQALISLDDLVTILDKDTEPFLIPEYEWEQYGHASSACIVCNTLVRFKDKLCLYYGAADHVISRAVAY